MVATAHTAVTAAQTDAWWRQCAAPQNTRIPAPMWVQPPDSISITSAVICRAHGHDQRGETNCGMTFTTHYIYPDNVHVDLDDTLVVHPPTE